MCASAVLKCFFSIVLLAATALLLTALFTPYWRSVDVQKEAKEVWHSIATL